MGQKIIRGDKKSQEENRRKVVSFLKNELGTHKYAASLFGLSKGGVDRIWLRYKNEKKNGNVLGAKKRGPKRGWKLSAGQEEKTKRLINREPSSARAIWDVGTVKSLILEKCKVDLSRWQVSRYLTDWGYASQKPIQSLLKKKSESEKKLFDKYYQVIKRAAKKHNAVIYFGDETGRQSEHLEGARHVPPAVDGGVILKSKKDFSVSKISAINSKGHLQFTIINGAISSNVIQKFLEQLKKNCKKKLFYITDSSHKTKQLDKWSRTNGEINVCFLPTDFQKLATDEDFSNRIKGAFQTAKKREKTLLREDCEDTNKDILDWEYDEHII
jgi:transposase